MKKLLFILAVLGAASFSYAAADKPADQQAPAKDEKCCQKAKDGCCMDKAHAKDCTCEKCKAAAEKSADKKSDKM